MAQQGLNRVMVLGYLGGTPRIANATVSAANAHLPKKFFMKRGPAHEGQRFLVQRALDSNERKRIRDAAFRMPVV